MNYLRQMLPLCALLAVACGDDKAASDSNSSTGDETSATTGDTSSASTTDASATATGTASDGTATTTAATTEATTTEATTLDPTTTDGTTGNDLCELVAVTCAAAEGGGPFLDCGVVDPWESTTEEWQAAALCALDAAKAEKAFKLITWLQGFDSNVGYGYVGVEGESYSVIRFFYDSYPPAFVNSDSCMMFSAEMDCEISPGYACLRCDSVANSTVCGG